MIRSLIWDFDGMLYDTYPHMIEAMRRTLADFGRELTSEQIFAPIKRTVTDCFRMFLPDFDRDPAYRDRVLERWHFWELPEHPPHAGPFPEVPDLLRAICADGRRNYVYSHRGPTTFQYLDEQGLRDCFTDFVTGERPFPRKPAPDALLYLIDRHNLCRDETMMLGDRELDVLCGKNAGVHSCLFDQFGDLPASVAEHRIRTHSELYGILGVPRR